MDRFLKIGFCFLFLSSSLAFSQSCFTVKYFGLTIHPFGDNQARFQPYKLDDEAHLILNFGGFAGYEKYLWEDIVSAKVIQGIFSDCSAGLATITHIGLRGFLFENKKHKLAFGIGPTFIIRNDWNRFDGYEDSDFFNRTTIKGIGNVQYKLFYYGFELEYDYRLSDKVDFSLSFTPGVPLVMALSFGVKYWFSKEFNKKLKLVKSK